MELENVKLYNLTINKKKYFSYIIDFTFCYKKHLSEIWIINGNNNNHVNAGPI